MGRALRHHSSSRRQSKERENNWLPKLTLENLLALLLVVAIICFVIISSLNSVVDLTVAVIPQTKETVRISNQKKKIGGFERTTI